MMNPKHSSKSGLFLMELILAIFFFSIASAICVRLFVTSHQLSKQSVQLNDAVTMAESIAEAFYGCNGDEAQLSSLLTEFYTFYEEEKNLTAHTTISHEEELITCHISILSNQPQLSSSAEHPIYELNLLLYPQEDPNETK